MKITRRGFLGLATVATAGVAVGGYFLYRNMTNPNYIDAHVHVWTPDTSNYPLTEGKTEEDMNPRSFTPEELFAHCKPQGVSRIVLIQMSFYRFDNSYMLDVMRDHPGVFGGVAVIDEKASNVTERMDELAQQGVKGFRLYASRENAEKWSTSDGMKSMWRHAADNGLAMCCLADPDALPAIRGMCENNPRTTVVIDHFARIGMRRPVADEQEALERLLRLGDDFETTYVKTSAFYALGEKAAPYTDLGPMVRRLRDTYGAQRPAHSRWIM